MSGSIFISYRRDDTAGFAGRIFDRLIQNFPREQIFMDVDNIEPGLDFVEVLTGTVGACDALLAVMGPAWVRSIDAHGKKRLDNPHDFVRIEIEAALRRNVRVIPILVDGARMPRPDELPETMRALTRRQALEISHSRFNSDVDGLVRALKRAMDGGWRGSAAPVARSVDNDPKNLVSQRVDKSDSEGFDDTESGDPFAEAKSINEFVSEQARFFNEGRFEEGVASARRARAIHGESPYFWSHEGICLNDLGRHREALECFDRGLKLAPNWVQLWANKGRTLRVMGRTAEALACYDKAIECDPDEVTPWDSKGNCLCDLFRLDEARKCYERALQIDPTREDIKQKLMAL